jgi:hypothetical protein
MYHWKGETAAQLTKIYWPLWYLNPCGFDMCRASTLPGYTATFKILTGLTLDLSALTNRSPAYKITGIARYIQVYHAKEDKNVIELVTLIKDIINFAERGFV